MPNKQFSYENYEKQKGRPIVARKSFFSSDVECPGLKINESDEKQKQLQEKAA